MPGPDMMLPFLAALFVLEISPGPDLMMVMFAFLPQFVDPASGPVWLQLLVLGSLQKIAGIFSLGAVALASGTVGLWLQRRPGMVAWQRRFCGVVMIGLALRLIFSGNAGAASGPSGAGLRAG